MTVSAAAAGSGILSAAAAFAKILTQLSRLPYLLVNGKDCCCAGGERWALACYWKRESVPCELFAAADFDEAILGELQV